MNDLWSVTIKDDSGKDCYIDDIGIFQKHLNEFNKKDSDGTMQFSQWMIP